MRRPSFRSLLLPALAALLLAACGGSDSLVRDLDTRAVVIGIDGADWKIIEELAEEGGMPNLMGLRQRGVWGPIATLPSIPLSPVIWTSVATGKGAKKHGITWFMVDRPDGTRVPVRSYNREVKAIWNLLAEHGRKAAVLGWWATYPAEDLGGGVMITDALGFHGFGSTARRDDDAGKTYPGELYAEVSARMPAVERISFDFARRFLRLTPEEYAGERFSRRETDETVVPASSPRIDPANPIHLFQEYAATAEGYAAIAEDLLQNRDDDLTMVYFEQVDSFSHLFMKYAPPKLDWVGEAEFLRYRDIVFEWYRYQDELLGRLLEKIDLDETAVFILSDHGFKSGERRIHSTETVDVRRAHLDHEHDGIFAAAGPNIRRGGAEIPGASVLDLTPTLLYYLGFPVAEDMDGRVLERIFSNDFRQRNPIRTIATYEEPEAGAPETRLAAGETDDLDPEEVAAAEEGLRALGYLGGSEDGGGDGGGYATAGDDAAAAMAAAAGTESSPEIHNNLGRVYLGDGELDQARAEFEKALAIAPENAEALLNLGAIHRVQGRVARAEHFVKRALNVDPNSIGALGQLAEIKRQQGDLDESIRLYREALQIDDSQPGIHLGLGDSLQRAGRFDEAEAAFRTVLGLNPDSYEAHYNLGVTYMNTERTDDAVAELEKALELDSKSPRAALAYNNLGGIQLARGEREQAIGSFGKAAAVAPAHLESHFNLGMLHLQAGEVAEAIPQLERAAAIDPNHETVNVVLGKAYLAAGRNQEAFKSFLLVRRLYPKNWNAALGLSLLAAGSGQQDKARELLADALEQGGARARAEAGRYPLLEEMLAELGG